jgi:hypothetical protein
MQVFVLLFNAGTDNEGIHTLKVGDRNIVLMFESEDDATRYSLMLEAQDFGSPTVEGFEQDDIEEFCVGANYECKVVPTGTLEVPPEANAESTDWNADGTPADVSAGTANAADTDEFSADELDRIRRRLESLL